MINEDSVYDSSGSGDALDSSGSISIATEGDILERNVAIP